MIRCLFGIHNIHGSDDHSALFRVGKCQSCKRVFIKSNVRRKWVKINAFKLLRSMISKTEVPQEMTHEAFGTVNEKFQNKRRI